MLRSKIFLMACDLPALTNYPYVGNHIFTSQIITKNFETPCIMQYVVAY